MTKDVRRAVSKRAKKAVRRRRKTVRARKLASPLDIPEEAYVRDEPADQPDSLQGWSYSCAELEAIQRAIPKALSEQNRGVLLTEASAVAQQYVTHTQLRAASKPNPRNEIECLKAAVIELLDSIDGIGSEAKKYLRDNLRPVQASGEKPFAATSLRYAAERFLHENRDALEHPPRIPRGGPRTKSEEQWIILSLWLAFARANCGKECSRGFPAFRNACCRPLQRFGLLYRSDEVWESILTKAKANAAAAHKPRAKGYKGWAERLRDRRRRLLSALVPACGRRQGTRRPDRWRVPRAMGADGSAAVARSRTGRT
jgi:hypothetical protein